MKTKSLVSLAWITLGVAGVCAETGHNAPGMNRRPVDAPATRELGVLNRQQEQQAVDQEQKDEQVVLQELQEALDALNSVGGGPGSNPVTTGERGTAPTAIP